MSGKKKVTSTDIARAAGVSQSTVSMVLNRKYNVSFSKETVEKVEKAARELGYVLPKRKLRRESRGEKLLVVFCSNLTNPYYVMLLQGIESRAKEQGYGLFVCNTQRDLKMEERYLKMMKSLKPLGIISTCNPSHCFMDTVEQLAEENALLLVLENLQDPGNLGTILRTGEGAGVTGIIMSRDTVDIYNPKVIRSTMGSIFRVPFVYADNMEQVMEFLKKNQITAYAAHLDGTNYTKEDYRKSSAFFIGNEGNGLSDGLTRAADRKIKIPMSGNVESLNAAMAAGLLMYEARRQREEGGD